MPAHSRISWPRLPDRRKLADEFPLILGPGFGTDTREEHTANIDHVLPAIGQPLRQVKRSSLGAVPENLNGVDFRCCCEGHGLS
jgi:hypothetical protein